MSWLLWGVSIWLLGMVLTVEVIVRTIDEHQRGEAENIAIAGLIWPIYLPALAWTTYIRWRTGQRIGQ